ncbi:MAG: VanW family protein [Deltaproteobacteria bacterium]
MHCSRWFRSIKNPAGVFLAVLWLIMQLLSPAPALAADSLGTAGTPLALPGKSLTLSVDGQICSLSFLAYQDTQGSLLLSLSDTQNLLGIGTLLDAQQNLHLQGDGHTLVLAPDEYIKYDSWSTFTGPDGKAVRLDMIYLPLAMIAAEWGYQLKESAGTVSLISPACLEQQAIIKTEDIIPDGLPGWGNLASVPAMTGVWPDDEIVGGYYTTITNSSANRINNIVLSCSSINGRVLAPGEVFSFNGTVGQRTTQRGYRTAPVYSGNKVVTGVGGGICQTSTTLYNAARESGMQVIERHHHTLPVHYIASGNDATVSWGTADFKFRNNKDYRVKIMARVYKNYVILAIARAD